MSTRRAPCPICDRGPRDTAFSYDDTRGKCFRCDYSFRHDQCRDCGAPIVWLETDDGRNVPVDEKAFQVGDLGKLDRRHRCGQTSPEHRERLPTRPARTTAHAQPLEWSTRAESIWRRSQGLRGTLGQRYLEHRGCTLPPRGSHLRYLPSDDRYPASLCAAVTDVVSAKPISLHFTRLATDGRGKAGTDCDKVLLAGHRKRGGCIRLWPDDWVTSGLAIAEGIETALAGAHVFTPVWAAIDAGNLRIFPVLAGIDALTIFADHDPAGLNAAHDCAGRWLDAGSEVRIRRSRTVGADIADEVAA